MKILLIDDEEIQRILLRQVIENRIDCEIYEAKNGIEGLRLVEKYSPDLIILDIWMPIMSGLEMLNKLRMDEVNKSIPVVIITALQDKETIQSAVSKGIAGYILKPFSPDQVNAILSKFIPSNTEKAINTTTVSTIS